MGGCNSPDIFQEHIHELFEGFYIVFVNIYNILFINKDTFVEHLKALETVLQKLVEAGLKLKVDRSFFGRT